MITFLSTGLSLIGWLLFGLAVFWDGASLYLILARMRKGSGPSPVPLVSWMIYFLWLIVIRPLLEQLHAGHPAPLLAPAADLRLFGVLTLYHLLCQAGIPALYYLWVS